eukprot:CAMPEP_0178953086 /NCGR_PEP_ID=MMETSP0789-20121207/8218_1 /TAXON_ID=3005 /ORGANISM="Rhizosolenia setigera, Strain CCMP 1694" /LENGTH=334 /DNA_ID=CAMNT_0020634295 /DNA_START=189 /DNA_END=1193 /DNA_ORIENTATION=-
MMSYSQSLSNSYYNNHEKSDDSSTVFDEDTVALDEVPSSTPLDLAPLTATATATAIATDYHHNNNDSLHPSQESPGTSISELLRRMNSRPLVVPLTNRTAKKGPNKIEARWRSKFQELCAFKQLHHGHTNVLLRSQDHRDLAVWVNRQRKQYNLFKANKKSSMTSERIEMLNSIGFEWVSQNIGATIGLEWNRRFIELSAYKEMHGNTNVPAKSPAFKQLGAWVSKQRSEYRKFKKNKKAYISLERIQMLESIGFEWELPSRKWNKRFAELLKYKELYGNTNVPVRNKYYRQLGLWVTTQRQERKKLKANKYSTITPERIQMLDSIGFEWSRRP